MGRGDPDDPLGSSDDEEEEDAPKRPAKAKAKVGARDGADGQKRRRDGEGKEGALADPNSPLLDPSHSRPLPSGKPTPRSVLRSSELTATRTAGSFPRSSPGCCSPHYSVSPAPILTRVGGLMSHSAGGPQEDVVGERGPRRWAHRRGQADRETTSRPVRTTRAESRRARAEDVANGSLAWEGRLYVRTERCACSAAVLWVCTVSQDAHLNAAGWRMLAACSTCCFAARNGGEGASSLLTPLDAQDPILREAWGHSARNAEFFRRIFR